MYIVKALPQSVIQASKFERRMFFKKKKKVLWQKKVKIKKNANILVRLLIENITMNFLLSMNPMVLFSYYK